MCAARARLVAIRAKRSSSYADGADADISLEKIETKALIQKLPLGAPNPGENHYRANRTAFIGVARLAFAVRMVMFSLCRMSRCVLLVDLIKGFGCSWSEDETDI